jgi:hypothetical protein
MQYIKNHTPKHMEKGMDIASKPLTPKSERPRVTWGSMAPMSLHSVKGLCPERKCVRKDGHADTCWPT